MQLTEGDVIAEVPLQLTLESPIVPSHDYATIDRSTQQVDFCNTITNEQMKNPKEVCS